MSIWYNVFKFYKKEKNIMARVLISMSDEFLSKIDSMAKDDQRTRSELIREALRTYMRRNRSINIEKASKNAEMLEGLLD